MPKLQALALPTVYPLNHTGMDISTGQVPANNCKVRGRTPTTALNLSRESSMASSGQATPYHDRMDNKIVVATTHHSRTNDLTTSKALQWGYQVTNGGLQENSTRSPRCIAPLFI